MRTIWKFTLPLGLITAIEIPSSAVVRFTGIDVAFSDPAIWVELDTEEPRQRRNFMVFDTGDSIPGDGSVYVGTVIHAPFVWHVFEVKA